MNEINLTSNIAEAGVFLSTSGDESVPDCKFEMAPVMYFDEGLMAIPILLDGYLILPRGGPASMVSINQAVHKCSHRSIDERLSGQSFPRKIYFYGGLHHRERARYGKKAIFI
jgi:hypothetical protein